ncbi:hypothetical protein ACLFMI_06050 [Pseudonocardia nantongensis]|uniref:hypothetical protein n=1 Tax=Pseudonocardia nantongensis TaxID=1181885 RepID=UPI00397DAD3D
MTRLAGAVVGMAAVALAVAYLGFGWPVLVLGGPLLVGITTTVAVLVLTEGPRAVLRERREGRAEPDSPWRAAAERGEPSGSGLMSGFFDPGPQSGRDAAGSSGSVPRQRPVPRPARPAGAR